MDSEADKRGLNIQPVEMALFYKFIMPFIQWGGIFYTICFCIINQALKVNFLIVDFFNNIQ